MSFVHSHLNTAVSLLSAYNGAEPFHLYLKKYFAAHRKHGSRDRKTISQFCYAAFRLGKAAQQFSWEEQVLLGQFLCTQTSSPLLQELRPEWNGHVSDDIEMKIRLVGKFYLAEVFPWQDQCSEGIDANAFIRSHFQQPLLFLRVRPGKKKQVTLKLQGIPFEWIGDDGIALENSTNIKDLLKLNEEVVVQDISSQETGKLMQKVQLTANPGVWDCCAASGGKSILVSDIFPSRSLTVSDVRPGILSNLHNRLREAGLTVNESHVIDLSDVNSILPSRQFDLVIADVPCSGSGTWGRTPEQLYFFDPQKIDYYAKLQSKIIDRVADAVKPGGYLLYCTCSVFKEENETQVDRFLENHSFEKTNQQLIRGYQRRSDTLFASLLHKPSKV